MLRAEFVDSISRIGRDAWNRIAGIDYPFTRYEFLAALEYSGATTKDSGWQPFHLAIYEQKTLVALLPLYLKYHSYGEYVFDWSWADAYERAGLSYYPKLLCAIPYTPATGPRLLLQDVERRQEITAAAVEAMQQQAVELELSSIHILLSDEKQAKLLDDEQLMCRTGVQYHWFNDGFESFDQFLATFNSRKRKNLKKERARVGEQGVSLRVLQGAEITDADWDNFFLYYQMTYAKRSGHGGYLNREFFNQLHNTMTEQIVLVLAYHDNRPVAAALNFRSSDTLYGRYWGLRKRI